MPPDPPVPVSAYYSIFTGMAHVTFDRPLIPGPLDPTNWTARINNNRWGFGNAAVFAAPPFTRLDCWNRFNIAIEPGPDVIDYDPPPFDVVASASGLPAAGFVDFPLLVVP